MIYSSLALFVNFFNFHTLINRLPLI